MMREGQATMPDLLPDVATRKEAGKRIEARARMMLDSDDRSLSNVGFFLLGVAWAAMEVPHV